jgi:hypothetical protein
MYAGISMFDNEQEEILYPQINQDENVTMEDN